MNAGFYLVKLLVGNQGMPGAPLLHLHLGVDAPTGQVVGEGEITQATGGGDIRVQGLKGQIHSLGIGEPRRVVALQGECEGTFPPAAIGEWRKAFSAVLVIGDDWTGQGSFTCGDEQVDDVPVEPQED